MSDGDDFRFMVKELSEMKESLSNKIDKVNDNITTVKKEVAELRGTSMAQLDFHSKCITELQMDRNRLWQLFNETDKRVAVHEARMNNADIPKSFEEARPYIEKLIHLRFKDMTIKEKLATTGVGSGTALGLLYAIFEYGPSIYEILFG